MKDWKLLEMVGNSWKWLEMAGYGWEWLKWLKMAGMAENGWIYQDLRISLEWCSDEIYFSTHQYELIHHKIIFKTIRSIVY